MLGSKISLMAMGNVSSGKGLILSDAPLLLLGNLYEILVDVMCVSLVGETFDTRLGLFSVLGSIENGLRTLNIKLLVRNHVFVQLQGV